MFVQKYCNDKACRPILGTVNHNIHKIFVNIFILFLFIRVTKATKVQQIQSHNDLMMNLQKFFKGSHIMFRWAIIFAVVALIASILGFGGVAGLSKDFAVIFLVVAVILFIVGFISRGKV